MSMIYHEDDGDMSVLADKVIGVVGYGHLGRPMALNLRDSGLNVQVGVRAESTRIQVMEDGLRVRSIEDTVRSSDILMLMMPDEVMPQVYLESISPNLKRGDTLIFASGYTVAFGFIEPPPFVDVGLLAPRTLGEAVRDHYLKNEGFYSFIAAGQDASGTIWSTLLALAKASGSLKAGAVEITMEQEAELDLFLQQAILPVLHHTLTTAARLLLEMGYPPEAAMMDLYISGELTDFMQRASTSGMLHALRLASLTGQYGIFSRMERFRELKLERLMEVTLEEIQAGDFAKEWAKEYSDGYPRLRKHLHEQEQMDLWDLEMQTIEMLRGL